MCAMAKRKKKHKAMKDLLEEATAEIRKEIKDANAEALEEEILTTGFPVLRELSPLKPLTIIAHTGDINFNKEGTFVIDHQMCLDQADWSYAQRKFMPGIEGYLELFKYKKEDIKEDILDIKVPTLQHRKIVGMIEMLVGVCRMMKQQNNWIPVYIELPEMGLHPSKVSACASLIAHVISEFKMEEIIPAEA
jgi:hypothetical protein